jgi:DGQHR domain-containing protein
MELRGAVDTPTLEDHPEQLLVTDGPDLLASLEAAPTTLASLFRVRNREVEYRSVHTADVAEMEAKGWQIVRVGKRQTRLKRAKSHARALEDRIWCMLYRMGYTHLSPAQFTIPFERESGSQGTKQIDALACDDETAIVVECKSKDVRGRRTLQKDLLETKALQPYIRESVYSHHRSKPKPKLIWIYATNNVIWSEPDIERAKDASIYILTENEIQYFDAYLRHMGPAGKYQILGELLHGQKVPGLTGNKVPAIKGSLGGHKFYSFVATPRTLLKIAFVNHQALNHPDGRPAYQRMVSSKRLKEIGDFITRRGGFFPTNILVNFAQPPKFEPLSNKENALESVRFGWLTLPTVHRSAWIIDGQHRLYGYSRLTDPYLDQNLVVIAFDGMEIHQEADLFITINHKQKSVPTSLLVSLLADLRIGDSDPQVALSALASRVVRRLSTDIASPLSRRFALPDVPAMPGQNLTISEVVKGLNRSGLIGRVAHGSIVLGPLCGATDDDSIERSRIILNSYFDALRTANPQRWESGKSAYICVNPGIRAHLMLISEIVSYLQHRRGIDFLTLPAPNFSNEIVKLADPVFDFVHSATDEKVKDRFSRKFGEGGVREYLFELFGLIHAKYSDFGSEEFWRYIDQ